MSKMASTEGPTRAHDRHARRRPFANWMKRLANLKSLHSDSNTLRNSPPSIKNKKTTASKHSPYSYQQPEPSMSGRLSSNIPQPGQRSRHSSISYSKNSISALNDGQPLPKSRAPTLATTAETTVSGTGTIATTAGRTDGDRDSTFSSPSPSVRSMTTTLTTIQSSAPANAIGTHTATTLPATTNVSNIPPPTAIPAHLTTGSHPITYHTATANNLLTDDASVLTLASSTKRRRRNSVDSKASIRALAPASMFGGSRESLPLSVLSGTVINPGGYGDSASIRDTASSYYPRSASAMNVERASLISANGITAALSSDRNSYIGPSRPTGDGASVRSGLYGHGAGDREGASSRADRLPLHGRNDSLGGASIGAASLRKESQRDSSMMVAPVSPLPS